ncbi:DUF1822 family protein [Limnoraphis robusta]|uniref:DUF1822 family protein n=1 Tax=Limnoraphis robusta CCNP1315 TaxID=3110306 RepID=A0ABU5TS13_9CYAN|nr:DUF1822 family protein [Limnoraphis robusta]MEA5517353.1 DUF1822 family protein [Limnoraphis robusta CCNP1315]MEA5546058.1 DUF1822 family protein [Limnoraphis robusta CCNP1324]
MKNTMMEFNPLNFGKYFAGDSICLTLDQVNLAAEMSQTLANRPRQKWQVYLNILAKLGMVEWLRLRAPELTIEHDLQLSSLSVNQVKLDKFRLNLIVTDSSMNTEVCVPRVLLENEINASQLYVLVEVIEDLPVLEDSEEQVNVSVLGYLTQAQLSQQTPIILDDELALFSTDWFELKPDKLLLYLRCFEPEPVSSKQQLYQAVQPVLNVANWLNNQLDKIAQDLSWMLLPPLSYSSEFRDTKSPMELFSEAVNALRKQDPKVVVPFEARTAYRELVWGEIAMRLYATTWQINPNSCSPEWTLLLLLTSQPSSSLPVGTQLRVRDELKLLEEPVLTNPSQAYIYAQVIGDYNEQFSVTINFPNGTAITLPPFTFIR